MTTALHESVEKKGTFRLTGDLTALKEEIDDIPFDYDTCEEDEDGNPVLSEEQVKDIEKFKDFLKEDTDWAEIFNRIPRKKNGTFYNNRVLILAQGHSFSWDHEERYGMYGPELRIKTHSDTDASLEFHWTIIEKW